MLHRKYLLYEIGCRLSSTRNIEIRFKLSNHHNLVNEPSNSIYRLPKVFSILYKKKSNNHEKIKELRHGLEHEGRIKYYIIVFDS